MRAPSGLNELFLGVWFILNRIQSNIRKDIQMKAIEFTKNGPPEVFELKGVTQND